VALKRIKQIAARQLRPFFYLFIFFLNKKKAAATTVTAANRRRSLDNLKEFKCKSDLAIPSLFFYFFSFFFLSHFGVIYLLATAAGNVRPLEGYSIQMSSL
jgi:hypothetical protein